MTKYLIGMTKDGEYLGEICGEDAEQAALDLFKQRHPNGVFFASEKFQSGNWTVALYDSTFFDTEWEAKDSGPMEFFEKVRKLDVYAYVGVFEDDMAFTNKLMADEFVQQTKPMHVDE